MRPFVVGLTGGIGSGKSRAAALFGERGVEVIDADALAHALTAAGGEAIGAIRSEFGAGFIDATGALDRARMRALVFADPDAKFRLERILHPMIRDETDRLLRAAHSPYVILMIPLLVESGQSRARSDRVLVVDCTEAQQIERVMARSGLARTEVEAIMATQASRARRLAEADDVLDNSGGIDALAPQVSALHDRYLALARTRTSAPQR